MSECEHNIDTNSNQNLTKCQKWLENCQIPDDYSDTSDYSINQADLITISNSQSSPALIASTSNAYEDIVIKNSRKVHLGNVTVINGPVYMKKTKSKANTICIESQVTSQEELRYAKALIRYVGRQAWVSQPPMADYELLEKPAKFIIICHSATDAAASRPENVLLVRYLQQFHIESRHWTDIAYNFLIGCDGYVYKGRGWGVVGAHTFKYNSVSLGICFVGTFIQTLPPRSALDQAQRLIRYGVEEGEIDPDYILIGNCQASSSSSPGHALYEEIKTWPHFDETISLTNPSPFSAYFS